MSWRKDKIQTVTGAIYGRVQVSGSSRMQVTTLHVKDLTGTLKVIWFRMPFLRNTLSGGGVITLRGRVVRKKTGDLVMEHPEMFYPSAKYEEKLHTLQPVYGLTAGLSNNMVMKAMKQALDGLDLSKEILPDSLRLKYGWQNTIMRCEEYIFLKIRKSFIMQESAWYSKNFWNSFCRSEAKGEK